MSGYLQNARLGALAQSFYGGLQTARTAGGPEQLKPNCRRIHRSKKRDDVDDRAQRDWQELVGLHAGFGWRACAESARAESNECKRYRRRRHRRQRSHIYVHGPRCCHGSRGDRNRFTNPALGACAPAGPVRCWSVVVSVGGQVRLCSPGLAKLLIPAPAGDISHEPEKIKAGLFLLEALIAILVFSLGILGMIAMGGAAIASQSDAQNRSGCDDFRKRDRKQDRSQRRFDQNRPGSIQASAPGLCASTHRRVLRISL